MKKLMMITCVFAGAILASCKGKSYESTNGSSTVSDNSVKSRDSTNNGVTKGVNTDGSRDPGTTPKHPNTKGNNIE